MPKAAELRVPHPPDQGGVYFEVHTPGVYRDLFGTLQAFDPLDQQMPLAVSLPAKVGSHRGWGDQRVGPWGLEDSIEGLKQEQASMINQGGTGGPGRGQGQKGWTGGWRVSRWEILELRVPLVGTQCLPTLFVFPPRSYSVLLAIITLAWWMNLAESSCRGITDMGNWEQETKWTEGNPHW